VQFRILKYFKIIPISNPFYSKHGGGGESSFMQSSVLLSGHLKIGGIEASRIPLDLTSISNGNSFSNLAFPHTDF
jgi:hypothetical protein